VDTLVEGAKAQAVEIARREGRRAASWYLTETAERPEEATERSGDETLSVVGLGVSAAARPCATSLKRSRWAEGQRASDRWDEQVLHLFATAATFPCEFDYYTFVVEPYHPERIAAWWRLPRADRLADPRVCAFCDSYERERCRLLGLPEPPTDIRGLQRYLAQAREREEASARAWLDQREEPLLIEIEETPRALARWEHLRSIFAAELAEMLLDAALDQVQVQ